MTVTSYGTNMKYWVIEHNMRKNTMGHSKFKEYVCIIIILLYVCSKPSTLYIFSVMKISKKDTTQGIIKFHVKMNTHSIDECVHIKSQNVYTLSLIMCILNV